MTVPSLSANEESTHQAAVQQLADELAIDVPIVREAWDAELHNLLVNATVREYLLVLASRATRDALADRFAKRPY